MFHRGVTPNRRTIMTKPLLELKWAGVFALTTIGWMALERLAGFHSTRIDQHATFTMLYAIPATAVYVFALLDKRRSLGGVMTYGQALVSGLWITGFVTLLTPLTQAVISMLVTPDYFSNMIAHSVQQGRYTQAEAENYFNLGAYIRQGLAVAPPMGILTTLVTAFFLKKHATT